MFQINNIFILDKFILLIFFTFNILIFIFNWRIITLWCCLFPPHNNFHIYYAETNCTGIVYYMETNCTRMPSFLILPPTPPSHSSRSSQSTRPSSLCYSATSYQPYALLLLKSCKKWNYFFCGKLYHREYSNLQKLF